MIGSDISFRDYGDHGAANGYLFIFLITNTTLGDLFGSSALRAGRSNTVVGRKKSLRDLNKREEDTVERDLLINH